MATKATGQYLKQVLKRRGAGAKAASGPRKPRCDRPRLAQPPALVPKNF